MVYEIVLIGWQQCDSHEKCCKGEKKNCQNDRENCGDCGKTVSAMFNSSPFLEFWRVEG